MDHKALTDTTIRNLRPAAGRYVVWDENTPAWGSRKARDITRRDVIELLDGIEKRPAPVERNRTAALLSKLFRVGMDRGVVETSPAVGISRLPEEPRDVLLTAEQIRSLWQG